ncbi:hypothetical protein [Streptomyces sp. NPDC021020]|uniref:hypothetical protein n=1 Tax=Streptomyces sp. NPDC021020 TaxID=3365109 RepID=UPI0037ADD1B6
MRRGKKWGPEDSWIHVPAPGMGRPRWAAVRGRHHIPTIGTIVYRKRWYSRRVRLRFLPADSAEWLRGQTDWLTMREVIFARTLGEARTLVALILAGAKP